MTAADFRRIALGMKDAIESAHMGHPDFRVNGRIFATLHPDLLHGMAVLTPDQQSDFMQANRAFAPENGAWGRQGCTRVTLKAADEETVGEALTLAWRNAVSKGATKSRPRKSVATRRPRR